MSILTVVTGSDAKSELVNDHGNVVAWLDDNTRLLLVKSGMPEKVVYKNTKK